MKSAQSEVTNKAVLCCVPIIIGLGIAITGWREMSELQRPAPLAPRAEWQRYDDARLLGYISLFGGGVLIAVGAIAFCALVPDASLRSRFKALGNPKGKTKNEVADAVGPPNETEYVEEGQVTRATWKGNFFSFTLEFRDDVCTGLVRKSDRRF